MPPKDPNFKVVGTKRFKLSELPVDGLIALAKGMNKKIRAEHVITSKAVLAQAKKDEQQDFKKTKEMLTKKLKDALILTAKRKKAQLIADIMRNKQHLPKVAKKPVVKKKEEPPEVDMSAETTDEEEEEEEKPKYVTRRIGGKIRRIPVASLKKAAEKKKEEKKEVKKESKPEAKATKEEKQIARIGSTRLRTKLAARFDMKAEQAEKKKEETKAKKPEPEKGSLASLKKELKAKGVPKAALKFIKTKEQAEAKLKELAEEETEDESVKISEKVLKQIPMKNQAKIKKLIIKVLPRDEFTLQDQVEYFNDLKEMGENWDMSSIPRQRYDKFDEDEKSLFELLYPAIFDKKAKKKRAEAKRAERKAKGE